MSSFTFIVEGWRSQPVHLIFSSYSLPLSCSVGTSLQYN